MFPEKSLPGRHRPGNVVSAVRILSPAEFPDAVQECAPLMSGPWSAVTNLPTLQSNSFSVILPNASQSQFFRLRLN